MKIYYLIIAFSLFTSAQQKSKVADFEIDRQNINQTAMLLLGSWAGANILTGAYGNFKAKADAKYFHQFNAMWNFVNLGIATFGYLNAINSNVSEMTSMEILKDYSSLQNFLLLNTGLDVAYIMTGFYLKEKSKNSVKSEMLRGYGNSLLLQGGFLLFFDVALYFVHQNNANLLLYPTLDPLLSGGLGFGLNLKL